MFTPHDVGPVNVNKEGAKHIKAKKHYNDTKSVNPKLSNALKGLKTAAQPNSAANSQVPGGNGFPNNSWS